MRTKYFSYQILLIFAVISFTAIGVPAKTGNVTLWKLSEGAIQPQAAADSKGLVHLIYFQGEDKAGNLFYMRLSANKTSSFGPIRINSVPNSAGAIGTVRTAQIAIGKNDRVHVVWNGLGAKDTYQAYTRLNDAGTAFEPQRNLITWAKGLDGGGSVSADSLGEVYVTWHAMANAKDEAGRAVFVTISDDDGKTFAREKQANPDPTGACACCGMRSFVDSKGSLYIIYRAAVGNTNRDTMLLVSRDKGRTFQEKLLDKWNINACPMSTYSFSESNVSVLAAWETKGRVYFGTNSPDTLDFPKPRSFPGRLQKHPFLVTNASGQTLIVWIEGSGWQRGGDLVWQVVDIAGNPIANGRKDGSIPVWGLAAAYSQPDGNFVIIY